MGIDKDNPLFSIYSPEDNPEMLEVYFGLALLERVERGKDSFQFKLLVGRLYNMKYRRKALVDAFGFDLKTIRKWGNALKSGQIGMIEAAFAGHEIRRKMTPEIESYARSRFRDIYQDFIHTSSGEPVFFKSFDNYYDLSERFPTTVAEFAQTLENPLRNLVFVIDRGIYSHDTLSEIHRRGDTIVTWEKGYGHDGWDDKLPVLHFRITRYRNSLEDTTSCEFDCVRYPFGKISGYDRIIVRARRDGKEDIEVSVLVNGDELTTEEAVTAINNFRNDHAILRELTRAPGFVSCKDGKTTVFLHPALTIQPKVREKLQLFLDLESDGIEKSGGGKIEFMLWGKDATDAKRGIFICDC